MAPLLEIACFNFASCEIAQQAGAHRIEFCADYRSGGITPSEKDITQIKKSIHIPVHVIIRPRGGDFIYSIEEINKMKERILLCKQHGIDGVVFGVLSADKTINLQVCKELLELAKPMKAIFHRAIDQVNDIEKEINKFITLKFDSVLTSGGKDCALLGVNTIKQLQLKYGKQINIIAGGGIRSGNISKIKTETNCNQFHSAALIDNTETANENEIRNLLAELNK